MVEAPRYIFTPIYDYRDYCAYRRLILNLESWADLNEQDQKDVKFEATRYNVIDAHFHHDYVSVTLAKLKRHVAKHDAIHPDDAIVYHWDVEFGLRQQLEQCNVSLFTRAYLATDHHLVELLSETFLGSEHRTSDVNVFLERYKENGYHVRSLIEQSAIRIIMCAIEHNDVTLLEQGMRKYVNEIPLEHGDQDHMFKLHFIIRMITKAFKFDAHLVIRYLLTWNSDRSTDPLDQTIIAIRRRASEYLNSSNHCIVLCREHGSLKCAPFLSNNGRYFTDMKQQNLIDIRYPCFAERFYYPYYTLFDNLIFDVTIQAIRKQKLMPLYGFELLTHGRNITPFNKRQTNTITKMLNGTEPKFRKHAEWALRAYMF